MDRLLSVDDNLLKGMVRDFMLVLRTTSEMLEDRGYDANSLKKFVEKDIPFTEFNDYFEDEEKTVEFSSTRFVLLRNDKVDKITYTIFYRPKKDTNETNLHVFLHYVLVTDVTKLNKRIALGKNDVGIWEKIYQGTKKGSGYTNDERIFITNASTTGIEKILAAPAKKWIFEFRNLRANPTKHMLCPVYRKVDRSVLGNIIDAENGRTIFERGPICNYYGFEKGTLLEITNNLPIDGLPSRREIYYRVVIPGKPKDTRLKRPAGATRQDDNV